MESAPPPVTTSAPDATGYCPSCGRTFPRSGGHCSHDGTRLVAIAPAIQDAIVGRVLDQRYEVRDALAEGRMGAMYRGWQISVSREVAIKVIHASFANDREAAVRFVEAARRACQLVAPSIVNVYDVCRTSDGVLYLVSELVRGRPLSGDRQPRAMAVRRVVGIAMQLCDALDAAHRHGIVHGDLKPANLMIDDTSGRDVLKVLDFGLASALAPDLTRPDPRRALPLYAAPEQLEGRAVDARADLYAVGCILHELLMGAPPFAAASFEAVVAKHRQAPAAALPPSVPARLVTIVQRLLAKAPGHRFASCGELRSQLLPVQAAVGMPSEVAVPFPRTHASTPPFVTRDPTTPPSVPPSMPPFITRDPTTPPTMPPFAQPFAQPQVPAPVSSPRAPSSTRRLLVILLVAILTSAGGIAVYLSL